MCGSFPRTLSDCLDVNLYSVEVEIFSSSFFPPISLPFPLFLRMRYGREGKFGLYQTDQSSFTWLSGGE